MSTSNKLDIQESVIFICPEGAFDDKRKSSEKLASFSREAGEASFSELFGVIEQSFLELFGAFPVIERTQRHSLHALAKHLISMGLGAAVLSRLPLSFAPLK